ncbi:low affinity iron permease family protein [Mesorhizobium sp. C089B]|uniref:low affinity iron permease family protein n=1 Tax=Mesorhizobium sp. C089B TaxID=2956823 RepID=UPI0025775983|nr:low affinity iron permease family protein [Mesorhizobium sp. C089B]WJI53627.1 low affinity iron permease family protein [Mesorhizobium sp. C089B]
MANHPVTGVLTSIGTLTSRPAAFLILLVYAILWMIFERQTLDWHGAATLFTWAMTLFIQRAEHRDTQAIHAKLDEILRSDHNASNITRIDDEEPEEIENTATAGSRTTDERRFGFTAGRVAGFQLLTPIQPRRLLRSGPRPSIVAAAVVQRRKDRSPYCSTASRKIGPRTRSGKSAGSKCVIRLSGCAQRTC